MSTAYDAWIGREENAPSASSRRPCTPWPRHWAWITRRRAGDALPPGWQWLFFNPVAPRGELGVDGHPKRGGFLPPIELPRRMWAGSRLRYLADLPVGAEATRRSRILKVENKVGKRGSLWFVTVEHTTTCAGRTCIVEEQDIVYREATPPGAAAAAVRAMTARPWGHDFEPDTTLLFRYSALTFNGHRIHYDQAYARHEEGYRDLVVHGPLTATLLQQLARRAWRRPAAGGLRVPRRQSAVLVDRAFRLEGHALADGSLALWARGPDGELAMSATAAFD